MAYPATERMGYVQDLDAGAWSALFCCWQRSPRQLQLGFTSMGWGSHLQFTEKLARTLLVLITTIIIGALMSAAFSPLLDALGGIPK